jgi:hypothetical protein
MAYEQRPGTGIIWKNDKYVQGGNQPYAKGTIKDLDGNDLDVALWIPKSDKIKGFNITMKPPYKKEEPEEDETMSNNEDLPF